jgi:hypothetical protein
MKLLYFLYFILIETILSETILIETTTLTELDNKIHNSFISGNYERNDIVTYITFLESKTKYLLKKIFRSHNIICFEMNNSSQFQDDFDNGSVILDIEKCKILDSKFEIYVNNNSFCYHKEYINQILNDLLNKIKFVNFLNFLILHKEITNECKISDKFEYNLIRISGNENNLKKFKREILDECKRCKFSLSYDKCFNSLLISRFTNLNIRYTQINYCFNEIYAKSFNNSNLKLKKKVLIDDDENDDDDNEIRNNVTSVKTKIVNDENYKILAFIFVGILLGLLAIIISIALYLYLNYKQPLNKINKPFKKRLSLNPIFHTDEYETRKWVYN